MKMVRQRFSLPLLMKELYEQAARRRTYVVRVVYASLLFLFGILLYYAILGGRSNDPFSILGQGSQLFNAIVNMQFMGIYLFMPAMTCGVVTGEKEHNSLCLLFLTRLGPGAILLEKYFSRVIPMLSFLMLSMPLLVIAYSLGGIANGYLWAGIWLLVVTVLQVGAIALCCSTYFRSTVSSFIATYLIGAMVLFGPVFCEEVLDIPLRLLFGSLFQYMGATGVFSNPYWISSSLFGPAIVSHCYGASLMTATLLGLPILISTLFFLVLARLFIVRRAFLPATYALMKAFRWLDGYFSQLNHNRLTRGVVLIQDADPIYMQHPVAWRETTKTALGSTRYLIRLLLIIEFPVAFLVVLSASSHTSDGITLVLIFLWILCTLILSVKGASLISGERAKETLDVLMTTRLRGSDIIRQKVSGMRRLVLVLSIPLLTIILFKSWLLASTPRYGKSSLVIYLICALLAVAIYLPLTSWFAFWVGLRVRNQTRAIFSAVAGLVAWSAIPVTMIALIFQMLQIPIGGRLNSTNPLALLLLLSPSSIIPFNEFDDLDNLFQPEWLAVAINFAFYGVCLLAIRAHCLRSAGRYLGRLEGGDN